MYKNSKMHTQELFREAANIGFEIRAKGLIDDLKQRILSKRRTCSRQSIYNAFDGPKTPYHCLILVEAKGLLSEQKKEDSAAVD